MKRLILAIIGIVAIAGAANIYAPITILSNNSYNLTNIDLNPYNGVINYDPMAGVGTLIDSAGNQYTIIAATTNTIYYGNDAVVIINRRFDPTGALNYHTLYNGTWTHDQIYSQDFGLARYPSAFAGSGGPYAGFPVLEGAWPNVSWGYAAGQYGSGGYGSGTWDFALLLGDEQDKDAIHVLPFETDDGNILFLTWGIDANGDNVNKVFAILHTKDLSSVVSETQVRNGSDPYAASMDYNGGTAAMQILDNNEAGYITSTDNGATWSDMTADRGDTIVGFVRDADVYGGFSTIYGANIDFALNSSAEYYCAFNIEDTTSFHTPTKRWPPAGAVYFYNPKISATRNYRIDIPKPYDIYNPDTVYTANFVYYTQIAIGESNGRTIAAIVWMQADTSIGTFEPTKWDIYMRYTKNADSQDSTNWSDIINITNTNDVSECYLHVAPRLKIDGDSATVFLAWAEDMGSNGAKDVHFLTNAEDQAVPIAVKYMSYTFDIKGDTSGVVEGSVDIVANSSPNTIAFSLSSTSNVDISIADVSGRTVKTISRSFSAGSHTVDMNSLSNGVYFYNIKVNGKSYNGRLIVVH